MAAGDLSQPLLVGTTPIARAFGLLAGAFFFGKGIFAPIADAISVSGAPSPVLFKLLAGLSAGTQMVTLTIKNDAAGVAWGVGAAYVFAAFFGPLAPALTSFLALVRTGAYIVEKADPSIDVSWWAFSGDMLATIPPFAQPIKYLTKQFPVTATLLIASLDMVGNIAAAMAKISNAALTWDTLAPPTALPPSSEPVLDADARVYLPLLSGQP
jgi:hypothetical protein